MNKLLILLGLVVCLVGCAHTPTIFNRGDIVSYGCDDEIYKYIRSNRIVNRFQVVGQNGGYYKLKDFKYYVRGYCLVLLD